MSQASEGVLKDLNAKTTMSKRDQMITDEHLLLQKERAKDPGYSQYTQYAY